MIKYLYYIAKIINYVQKNEKTLNFQKVRAENLAFSPTCRKFAGRKETFKPINQNEKIIADDGGGTRDACQPCRGQC